MRVVEKTARTVDDAIDQAIAELGTSREEVDVEIIDQPSKGFFGLLGTKPARVKVTVRNTPSRKVRAIMTDILATMNLDAKMDINEKDDIISVNLIGRKPWNTDWQKGRNTGRTAISDKSFSK